MADTDTEVVARCPKCGGEEIHEKNVAYCELAVWGWEVVDGELQPTDYDSGDFPDWEAQDCANQYVCHSPTANVPGGRRCGWEGSLSDLIIGERAANG